MKKRLEKGFTLVELIVVLVLLGLITTCIAMIIKPSNRLYSNVTAKSGEETTCITLGDYINGELRYSTGIKIYCNDGTTPTSTNYGDYKNFIKLDNGTRATSKKGANGRATHGLTSNFSGGSDCVSGALLDEYNVVFSLAGVDTNTTKESITIGMDMSKMVQNSAGTGFYADTDQVYNYTETFQLLNMQNKATIGKESGGLTADVYDESAGDTTIWIFYQKPAEAQDKANLTSTTTSSGAAVTTTASLISPGTSPTTAAPSTTTTTASTTVTATDTNGSSYQTYSGSVKIYSRASLATKVGQNFFIKGFNATVEQSEGLIRLNGTEEGSYEVTLGGQYGDSVCQFNNVSYIVVGGGSATVYGYFTEEDGSTSYENVAIEGISPGVVLSAQEALGHEFWYFDGYLYNYKPDGFDLPISEIENPGSVDITVHFSTGNVCTDDGGDMDYIVNDNSSGWANYSTKTYTVNQGEDFKVSIRTWWNRITASTTYSYDTLVSQNVSDIWIIHGQFLTEQPDYWVD